MTLVYEYQGKPFDVTNTYPMLSAGNNDNNKNVFTASFIKLANDGTEGKTRLTVTVCRIDFIGSNHEEKSNWKDTYLMQLVLLKEDLPFKR